MSVTLKKSSTVVKISRICGIFRQVVGFLFPSRGFKVASLSVFHNLLKELLLI